MKVVLLALFTMVALTEAQTKRRCQYPADVVLQVDTSDTNIDRDDRLGAMKRGLLDIMDIYDIGPGPDQTRLAICNFGSDFKLELSLDDVNRQNRQSIREIIGNNVSTGFSARGGFDSVFIGIQCSEKAAQQGRPYVQKLLVILTVANDLQEQSRSSAAVAQARQSLYVSTVAVGDRFTDIAPVEQYPSSPRAYTRIQTFADFEADASRFNPQLFDSFCPADLTTTTSTTTTQATTTPEGGPCDRCKMVNGVGYAATEDCFSFFQCIRNEEGNWVQFRRPVAVGAYWSQARLTGDMPARAACPADPCIGQGNGTVVTGYNNCRAKITCMGGVTAFIECCPEGQGLVGGQCVNDATCNEACEPVVTTPGVCFLSSDTSGLDSRFMATDGEFSLSMPCPIGTFYRDSICGCDHVEGPVPVRNCLDHPEVRLEFGPDGQVVDVSRNRYFTTTVNVQTVETSQGSGIYYARFDGDSIIRVHNTNSGKDIGFTLRVVYEITSPVQNAAVVSDNECLNSVRTISVIDDSNAARGFVRTVGDQTVTVDSGSGGGRKEVILQYNGEELFLDNNGRVSSADTGAILAVDSFCGGLKIGNARDLNGIVGNVYEVEFYKCLANGPQDFQQTPAGRK